MKDLIALDINGQPHTISEDGLAWRPSAYGIVVDDDKILLCHGMDGKYALPGGGVEHTETFEQAVEREVKEETGIDVRVEKFVTIRENLFVWKPDEPKERQTQHTILLYYVCKKVGGEISTDGFIEEEKGYLEAAQWVSLSELDTLPIGGSMDFRDVVREALV